MVSKATGPSGIIIDMLKAAGNDGIVFLRELITSVMINGKIPEDWEMSFILSLYKGKGDALDRGSYRGVILTEHVIKGMEKIMDEMIRAMIDIDEMQYAFVSGRGTTDAIFITRQLQEKFLARKDPNGKNRILYFAFVDLEKAFDRVPGKVLRWAMCSLGIDELVVRAVQSMYSNARSLGWVSVSTRALYLGLCFLSLYLRPCLETSEWVCPGNCYLLMTLLSLLRLLRSVLTVSRPGRRLWSQKLSV